MHAMSKLFSLFTITLFTLITHTAPARAMAEPDMKYGRVKPEDFAVSSPYADASTPAFVLGEVGAIGFRTNSFTVYKRVHVRIKILNQEGLDYANVSLYLNKRYKESITKVKATSYNLTNGVLKKSEMDKKDVYTEDYSKTYERTHFSVPNAKVGSIIEYEYTFSTEYIYTLPEWNFQWDIPVRFSKVQAVSVPASLNYTIVYNGARVLQSWGSANTDVWYLEDLPPLREDSYLWATSDYAERIRFQLKDYMSRNSNLTGIESKSTAHNWSELVDELYESKSFGLQLRKNYLTIAKDLLQGETFSDDQEQKLKEVYYWYQEHFTCDGRKGFSTSQGCQAFILAKRGSLPQYHLFFIQVLRAAGFEVKPVLLSTRDHGKVFKDYPLVNQFNYVLPQVLVNDKWIVVDATDHFLPPGMLPVNVHNTLGLALEKDNPQWIEVESLSNSLNYCTVDVKVDDDVLVYDVKWTFKGYEASSWLKRRYENKDLISDLVKRHYPDAVIDSMYSDKDMDNELMSASAFVRFSTPLQWMGAICTLSPVSSLFEWPYEFVDKPRYLPVELPYKSNHNLTVSVHLPETYYFDEIPEAKILSTPNKELKLQYLVAKQEEQTLQLSVLSSTRNRVIMPQFYPVLVAFENEISSLTEQQIVIKRKE